MHYIIYDLEFNQKNTNLEEIDNSSKETESNNGSNIPFEIIQIGALKLDENFQTLSTFNSLIKPTVYKSIHPYVENLTKITASKVASCKKFIDVHNDFLNFLGDDDIILCVWGIGDVKELFKNLKFYNLSTSYISKYIDVQRYASKYLKAPKGSKIGLRNAIDILNIPIIGEFHDALNDAYYTAEVFKHIYNERIEHEIYNPSPTRRVSKPKEKIDMDGLIDQIEKMYGRYMTPEEKSIIKLAYMMGKTRQFIL
jgi:inhibitor of KinA sporulation pathway (predicted exonuclease)